ncbi:MAG: diaminopimelate decarboxylase [Solirubrobacteraceae bacterium]|nr:diaminopimelate decarboxylase [Solirubrobacteraceae bacterium]
MATAQRLSAVWPAASRLVDDRRLEIGGVDAIALAKEFGTPAYIVAEDDLREKARQYLAAFRAHAPDAEVHFASKANPCTAVLRVFAEEGLGVDVASGGELHVALKAGFEPAKIILHGNAKSDAELRMAVGAGVGYIVIDNFADLERVIALATDGVQPVLLRVTPDVRGETHDKISTGQADSKFGLSLRDAPVAIERAHAAPNIRLDGLHLHIGSQLLELGPWRDAVEAVAPLGDFPVVNLGGGLGVAYTDADDPPSIEVYAAAKVAAARELLGSHVRIIDEPGRSLVANAGVTLYSVESIKRNVSTWVAVDGGMSDNLRPMLYGAKYEAEIADRFGGDVKSRITGKHCESGDVIVSETLLDDPKPGDVIVTPATGAYGYAMSNNYNGIPRPPVVFVSGGDARVVVRRETYEELTARDV